MKRSLEILVCGTLLILLAPVMLVIAQIVQPRVKSVTLYGRLGQPFVLYIWQAFKRSNPLWLLNYWHALWLVLTNKLALVGARPVRVTAGRPAYTFFASRPGLVSPYLIQKRLGMAHDTSEKIDAPYLRDQSLISAVAILLRFAVSLFYSKRTTNCPSQIQLLDVAIRNCSMHSAVADIAELAKHPRCNQVAFVNADCFNRAANNGEYLQLLQRLTFVLADGVGLKLAYQWFLSASMRANVNGTDLFPKLCEAARAQNLPIYLLGAGAGVAQTVAEWMKKSFPGVLVAGWHEGYWDASDEQSVIDSINASGAKILLVALGAPRQDLWIAENATKLNVGVAIGVGGLFDFYSGRIPRAPQWLRELGLEWTYRLIQEPGRMWRRYVIGNPMFLWRAWRWASSHKSMTVEVTQIER